MVSPWRPAPRFYDAFMFGRQHLELAGAVLQISFHTDSRVGILRSENPSHARQPAAVCGGVLAQLDDDPAQRESWVSPFHRCSCAFPFPAPAYAETIIDHELHCPIEFDSPTMEWHFDASILREPCASASSDHRDHLSGIL